MDVVKTRHDQMLSKRSDLPKKRQMLFERLEERLTASLTCMNELERDINEQSRQGADRSLELTRSDGNQIKCLKLAAAYFRAYCFFAGARCGIDDLIREKSYTAALNVLQLVCAEICELADSKCINLVRYSFSVYTAIDVSIISSFKRRMLNIMDALNFPFTAEDDYNFVKRSILESDKLFALRTLLEDTVMYSKIAKFASDELPFKRKGQSNDWRLRLQLPVRLLIHCIEVRFRFHFCTGMATNRIDKCQWYMNQLLSWYNGSLPFLLEFICENEETQESYQVDFAAGITRIASDKVDSDIRFILNHVNVSKADLFSHVIDEFVQFLAAMKPRLNAETNSWSYIVDILNEEDEFCLFMSVQAKRISDIINTLESEMDNMSSNFTMDSLSMELGEELASVLLSALDRISMFVRPSCQIRWYQMFKSCLHKVIASIERDTSDVRHKLRSSGRIEQDDALNRCFFILTRVIALYDSVVFSLQETPVLMKLQYLSEQFSKYSAKMKLSNEDDLTLYDSFDMSKEATFVSEEDCISLKGTPLETASHRLEELCASTLDVLASATLNELSNQRKNIIAHLHSVDEIQPEPKRENREIFNFMKDCYRKCNNVLRLVRQKIRQFNSALPLLMTFEEKLYVQLDYFFYKQVILDDGQQWSCPAANRFSHNIMDYWVDLVVQTGSNLSSDVALPRTACACRLLCMNPAGAKYLRDTLLSTSDADKIRPVIAEFNLGSLSHHDILQVLALRVE